MLDDRAENPAAADHGQLLLQLRIPRGAPPVQVRRSQVVAVRVRENDPVDRGEVDIEFDALPEGVRAEIDERIAVEQVTAPAANLFPPEFFRFRTGRTLTPQRRHALRRRCPQKSQFHRTVAPMFPEKLHPSSFAEAAEDKSGLSSTALARRMILFGGLAL